jgi:hypothetical protein
MARKHHRVGAGIWDQPWDDDMRLVAIYLMTCKHRAMEGLYRLPKAYGPADMGWRPARFQRAFHALVKDGFIRYDEDAQVVWLVNAMRWQAPQNPNQVKAAVKALQELPATALLNDFLTVAVTVSERFAEALRQAFPERFAERVANTPAPSPTPLLTQGARDEPLAPEQADRTYRFNGKPIPQPVLLAAQAVLADLNRQAGHAYRPFTDQGALSDNLSRIVGAMLEDKRITVEIGQRMIRLALAGDPYWQPGPFHAGHAFGRRTRESLLAAALANGATASHDAAAYVAAMNRQEHAA